MITKLFCFLLLYSVEFQRMFRFIWNSEGAPFSFPTKVWEVKERRGTRSNYLHRILLKVIDILCNLSDYERYILYKCLLNRYNSFNRLSIRLHILSNSHIEWSEFKIKWSHPHSHMTTCPCHFKLSIKFIS